MEINKEIKTILSGCGVSYDDGLTYLLSIYFGAKPSYIPESVAVPVNITKIVTIENGIITWKVPLFSGQETAFSWVAEEYVNLFSAVGKNKFKRESTTRMKRLFSSFPEIRKDDIIGATKIYLRNTDPKFVRFPHYFIEKGSGATKTQDILSWIDTYREGKKLEEILDKDETRRLL